jgi:hypothetical protein
MRKLQYALLGVLVLMGAFPPLASAEAVSSPQTVVLRISDMPKGFEHAATYLYTNTATVKTSGFPLSFMRHTGRMYGYQVWFCNPRSHALVCIVSEAIEFNSDLGATRYFDAIEKREHAATKALWLGKLSGFAKPFRDSAGLEQVVVWSLRYNYIVRTEFHFKLHSLSEATLGADMNHFTLFSLHRVPSR